MMQPLKYRTLAISLSLMCTCCCHAVAGKIYQWVDEDGNRHFTSTPPPDKKPTKVKLSNSGGMQAVEKAGSIYCGSLHLSYSSDKGVYNHTSLQRKTEQWKQSLDRYESQLELLIRSSSENSVIKDGEVLLRDPTSYSKRKEQLTRKANEFRCAIEWAENANDPEKVDSVTRHYEAAKRDYDIANQELIDTCGEKPEYSYSIKTSREKYAAWRTCSKEYNAGLWQKKNTLRKAEKDYKNVK